MSSQTLYSKGEFAEIIRPKAKHPKFECFEWHNYITRKHVACTTSWKGISKYFGKGTTS
jgi:hypothetical protein